MSFSYSLMISWADSIIIWSLSIIKLTLAQFKKKIFFFFKTLFLSIARQALGTRETEWRLGTLCSLTPSPTSSSQAQPHWVGGSQGEEM